MFAAPHEGHTKLFILDKLSQFEILDLVAHKLKMNSPTELSRLDGPRQRKLVIKMMYEKPNRPTLPRTVDEVADLLIADLPPKEMVTLSNMDEGDFLRLYDSVAQYVLDEFKIWTGNDDLLESCFANFSGGDEATDPAMVILRRVWQKLNDFPEILIIT